MCRSDYRVTRITRKLPTGYRHRLSAFSGFPKEFDEAFRAFAQTKDPDARRVLLAERVVSSDEVTGRAIGWK